MTALPLSTRDASEIVDVFCDAFFDYPVMRYILGSPRDYDQRLRTLVGFFVSARVYREEPMFGIRNPAGHLVAAAIMTLPGERETPEALAARREEVWRELGPEARQRYERYGAAAKQLERGGFHHHLNMIGVRRSQAGTGLARPLMEAVFALAQADPRSAGVSLTTELPRNLDFYRHMGYEQLGHARVSSELETWGFFRSSFAAALPSP